MSLVDALLLDPHPFNVWIAARTDGIMGSGTANDPYNGTPSLRISLLTATGATATATLATGHGLKNDDVVVMSGATGSDASQWNGTFAISNVSATSFQYTMGSAPASSPASGPIVAAPVARNRFDDVMNGLPANTRVHLGPGTFLTQGHADNVSGGWQMKPGMKITGSGIDITILQLVNHTLGDNYFAVGHALGAETLADLAEVSELTIDCNLANAGSSTGCSAVRLMGSHTKIARVKAIHWGSKSTNFPCSALSCVTALPSAGVFELVNTGIEACVVVTPGAANVAPCTAIRVGDPESSFAADGHGTSAYIRHCFVDCGVATPNPDPAAGKFRGLAIGWCRGGVVEGNHVQNADIGGPYQDGKRSARDIVVRNNFYRNVGRGPFWNLGTLGLERAQPSPTSTLSRSGTVGTVTNLSGFGEFDVGVRVKLVTVAPGDYTGVHVIQSKTGASFTVNVPAVGASSITVSSARKIFGVTRAIIEGNVIELAAVNGAVAMAVVDNNDASPYSEPPDYVQGDVIVRNNKIRYVDGAAPNDGAATLIDLRGVKNVIVQDNLIDTVASLPIQALRCGSQSYFDNRTVAGALLTVAGFTVNDFKESLELPAEDAFLLSCFNHH